MAYPLRLCGIILFGLSLPCIAEPRAKPAENETPPAVAAAKDDAADPDVRLLREGKIGTEEDQLVAYLKARSGPDEYLLDPEKLIRKLADDDFETREQASRQLVALGPMVLTPLRKACGDKDREMARRASECVGQIERDLELNVPLAAVRVLAARRPPKGLVRVLLQFLPYSLDEEVEEEIYYALESAIARDPDNRATLSAALADDLPARRAAAGCLLGRLAKGDLRAQVRKLLDDKSPVVRLRVAQGLLAGRDCDAIPALIELLNEPSVYVAWQAEELLHFAAGENAPREFIGDGSGEKRRQCCTAWEDWWRNSGTTLDLTRLSTNARRPGLILVCENDGFARGFVSICGCDGVARWRIQNLKHPSDARLLKGDHLLLVERDRGRVVECDLDGHIIWEKRGLDQPSTCRRLNNGITLVTTDLLGLIALTVDGKELRSLDLRRKLTPDNCLLRHLAIATDGRIFGLADVGRDKDHALLEFDRESGELVGRIPVAHRLREGYHYVESLLGGKWLLVGIGQQGKVLQIDRNGNIEWEYESSDVLHATRLLNGHTLICHSSVRHGRVTETDAAGTALFEWCLEGHPCRANPILTLVQFGFKPLKDEEHSKEAQVNRHVLGLASKYSLIRQRSCEALAEMGAASTGAVPALAKALSQEDPETRNAAQCALEALEPRLVPETLRLLKHKNTAVRVASVEVIRHSSNREAAVPDLLDASSDDSAEVRRTILMCLGVMRPVNPRVVAAVTDGLDDRDSEVRIGAAMTLGGMGAEGKPAIASLIKKLNGNDVRLRYWCALALGEIGAVDEAVVPALVSALNNTKDLQRRYGAACALGKIGPEAATAIPSLNRCLTMPDLRNAPGAGMLREGAASALGRIGPDAESASVLAKLAANKKLSSEERLTYLQVLGSMGRDASKAVPILEGLLGEKDETLRREAVNTLKKIK
jgi:HEAT repeat protein